MWFELATYVARARFPIIHMPGQRPPTFHFPGSLARISRTPPVKQNLFQPWTMPDRYVFLTVTRTCFLSLIWWLSNFVCSGVVVMFKDPPDVVT